MDVMDINIDGNESIYSSNMPRGIHVAHGVNFGDSYTDLINAEGYKIMVDGKYDNHLSGTYQGKYPVFPYKVQAIMNGIPDRVWDLREVPTFRILERNEDGDVLVQKMYHTFNMDVIYDRVQGLKGIETFPGYFYMAPCYLVTIEIILISKDSEDYKKMEKWRTPLSEYSGDTWMDAYALDTAVKYESNIYNNLSYLRYDNPNDSKSASKCYTMSSSEKTKLFSFIQDLLKNYDIKTSNHYDMFSYFLGVLSWASYPIMFEHIYSSNTYYETSYRYFYIEYFIDDMLEDSVMENGWKVSITPLILDEYSAEAIRAYAYGYLSPDRIFKQISDYDKKAYNVIACDLPIDVFLTSAEISFDLRGDTIIAVPVYPPNYSRRISLPVCYITQYSSPINYCVLRTDDLSTYTSADLFFFSRGIHCTLMYSFGSSNTEVFIFGLPVLISMSSTKEYNITMYQNLDSDIGAFGGCVYAPSNLNFYFESYQAISETFPFVNVSEYVLQNITVYLPASSGAYIEKTGAYDLSSIGNTLYVVLDELGNNTGSSGLITEGYVFTINLYGVVEEDISIKLPYKESFDVSISSTTKAGDIIAVLSPQMRNYYYLISLSVSCKDTSINFGGLKFSIYGLTSDGPVTLGAVSPGSIYDNKIEVPDIEPESPETPADKTKKTSELYNVWNTWDDFRLIPTSRPVITPPTAKTSTVSIPGGNGELDVSFALTNSPLFDNRTGTLEFIVDPDSDKNWVEIYEELMHYLGGYYRYMTLEDDPYYAYEGKFMVNSWTSDSNYSTIAIDYDIKPYKRNLLLSDPSYKKISTNYNILFPDYSKLYSLYHSIAVKLNSNTDLIVDYNDMDVQPLFIFKAADIGGGGQISLRIDNPQYSIFQNDASYEAYGESPITYPTANGTGTVGFKTFTIQLNEDSSETSWTDPACTVKGKSRIRLSLINASYSICQCTILFRPGVL